MKTITIEVEGGMVVDVEGLPKGWDYEIVDHDVKDETDLVSLIDEQVRVEHEIVRALSKLEGWDEPCNCGRSKIVPVIAKAEQDKYEVSQYCFNCGGYFDG